MKAGWIDPHLYPFASHSFETPAGRLHYVDEGTGRPVVFIHGTPTWSFLYRHLVATLSPDYRCLAPDNLGFGLSDRPAGWTYRPADHARNVEHFIDGLGLRDIILVVHDYGGPIGLSYALAHPDNVRGIVVFNSWLWPLDKEASVRFGGRLMDSRVGRWLYERQNFSVRSMLRRSWGDKATLTPEVYQAYAGAFPTPGSRFPTWVLAREVIGSSVWYASLWDQRSRLAATPMLLVWGERDFAFGKALPRWQSAFPWAASHRFPDAGHFVPEERPAEVARLVSEFASNLATHPTPTDGRSW